MVPKLLNRIDFRSMLQIFIKIHEWEKVIFLYFLSMHFAQIFFQPQ